ncbi:MAG: hypothetical protein INQ03_25355 [Candidatus Heimdallarchaeota archaeon]|nr:hypothetical protein [Candidatus Heimdallarchaeota archaeon]
MAVLLLDSVAGLFSTACLVVGYTLGFYTLNLYRQKKTGMLFLSSILFFTLPSPWIPDALMFWNLLLGGDGIKHTTGIYSSAWSIPILSTTWLYITAALYKRLPNLKKVFLGVGSTLALVFYYYIYILKEYVITDIPDSKILNIDYTTIPNAIVTIYGLGGIFFILPSYLYFSSKTEDALFKFRFRMIATSVTLFAISGVYDLISKYDNILDFILVRVFILISLICLYLGYVPPNMIRERY